MTPILSALGNRNFRIYAVGGFISNVGTWMQSTAMSWLVLQVGGGGSGLGAAIALQMLPTLVLSPWAGALADSLPKRTVIVGSQAVMATFSAILGVLAVTGMAGLWQVLMLNLLFGIGRAVETPARLSFVSELVDRHQMTNAVALNSASFHASRLIGPGVAGLLIAALGSGASATGWVILANAATYGASIGSLVLLDTRLLNKLPARAHSRGAVGQGVRYLQRRPDLQLVLTLSFFVGMFGMNFTILSALMATDEFGKGAREFGILGTLMAIGSLAGPVLTARRPQPRLRRLVIAASLFAGVQMLSALAPTYPVYAAMVPLVGLTLYTFATSANVTVQIRADPAMRGRVTSIYMMALLGAVPLGAPIFGYIGQHAGPRWALAASAVGCSVGVLVGCSNYLRQRGPSRIVAEAPAL
ncbi:MFS transporter [Nocardioides sp. Root1257]|uniref:MFS transporter n=1 Tax=unclassified Nocardioides TaxID=2615069 RepID=UPI0006FB9A38|nr:MULTISPECIES: MFS transporter [unclassified Nocardioides]KQW45904.1 MFS transporter [Nocardioides sp. Root1257]KRC43169.1 MFS transporter [Nocardioides sp. Root224]